MIIDYAAWLQSLQHWQVSPIRLPIGRGGGSGGAGGAPGGTEMCANKIVYIPN